MKDQLPLSAEDFRTIRRSVLATIERRRVRRVRAVQLAFAAGLIAVGIQWPKPAPPRHVEVIPAHATRPAPGLVIAAAQEPSGPKPPPARRHHRRHRKTVAPAASEPAPMRIELATADPDIRIIWISNPKESR